MNNSLPSEIKENFSNLYNGVIKDISHVPRKVGNSLATQLTNYNVFLNNSGNLHTRNLALQYFYSMVKAKSSYVFATAGNKE